MTAVRTSALPRVVGWVGIPIGAAFAANLFVPPLMNLSFITVPAWLVALGVAVARSQAPAVRFMAVAPLPSEA